MWPFVLATAALISIATNPFWEDSPETFFEYGQTQGRPPTCRSATPAELHERGLYPQGKSATFHLSGYYVCERKIFAYGERNSFVNFVTDHVTPLLKLIAVRLANEHRQRQLSSQAWVVRIDSDDEWLADYLRKSLWIELLQALGPGSVQRIIPNGDYRPMLHISLRRLQDPALLIGAQAYLHIGDKEMTMQVL